MKKVFIVSGELSGDKLGGWYLDRMHKQYDNLFVEAVGGDCIEKSGAHIYERFEKLNVTGVIEIVKHLPFILKFLKQLENYICENSFDEVVLIDFPGFNLMLAKRLKRIKKDIKITYLSPPQLWCWGQWRLKKLKKFCDELIVLYPFEVEWYRKLGLSAKWLGSPVYERLMPYFAKSEKKTKTVALLPGSRLNEIENLFPFFAKVIKKFIAKTSDITFVLPLAESIPGELIEKKMQEEGLGAYASMIKIIRGEEEKLNAIASCCLALTKPGTVTLELALLGVPTVMFYKSSMMTYFLAKCVVHVQHMALPNLLLERPVYEEFIQDKCTSELIFERAWELYKSFISDKKETNGLYNSLYYKSLYIEEREKILATRALLSKKTKNF